MDRVPIRYHSQGSFPIANGFRAEAARSPLNKFLPRRVFGLFFPLVLSYHS
jgi:hypothetical protein